MENGSANTISIENKWIRTLFTQTIKFKVLWSPMSICLHFDTMLVNQLK